MNHDGPVLSRVRIERTICLIRGVPHRFTRIEDTDGTVTVTEETPSGIDLLLMEMGPLPVSEIHWTLRQRYHA